MRLARRSVLGMLAGVFAPPVAAAGRPDEATLLRTSLTPVGAERAGNRAGTVPSWTGGYATPSSGYRPGSPRPDPFAAEKPLFSITAANVDGYAANLPEGARALFRRFPDYRMDIYPSHRSAAFPASVYENISRNASRAAPAPEGIQYGVSGAAGGIPFPVPSNGFEAMWNHLLAYWGPAREVHLKTYVASAAGTVSLTASYDEVTDFPYYYADATPQSIGGYYFKTRHLFDGPPVKAGQAYLDWQPINIAAFSYAAWRLLPGERRARRTPSIAYDVPDPDALGFENQDEYYNYFGGLDRYVFKLSGKRELFVPYNNNRLYLAPTSSIMGPRHANPDLLRYEMHRVWVIDAELAPGRHHVAPRRRLYLDEDTWLAVYAESWDESGNLWKFAHGTMYLMPDIPAVILGSQFVYDLDLGGYVFAFAFNDEPVAYKVTAPHSAALFTPEALAAQAVR